MTIIQTTLFILLLIATAIFFRYFTHQFIGRVIVLTLGLVLFFFILSPSAAHDVARIMGVGRGVDLIFYLAHAFLLILVGLLYVKIKKQHFVITELVRKLALESARTRYDSK